MYRLRLRIVAVATVTLVLAAGCGGSSNKSSSSSGNSSTTAAAAKLSPVAGGKLTVCSDIPYEPFEFAETKGSTTYTGYDMDILAAIAKANGLALNVRVTPFDGILGSLEAGDCDVIGSALTITTERKQKVDFSAPYFDADQSLLVKKDKAADFSSLDKMAGKKIGVQSATTGETYAKAHKPAGAAITSYPGAAELFTALEAGQIDAILQDFPVNAYRATKDATVAVTAKFQTGEQYGFAVKKGNAAMLKAVNDGLAKLRSSGDFDAIFTKYFGTGK